jgi:hypothetical protein
MRTAWNDDATAAEERERSLLGAIAAGARRASDGALVASAIAGLVACGGLLWMQGRGWGVLLPLVAVGLWGGWGIVDRTLRERATVRDQAAAPAVADALLVAARIVLTVAGMAVGVAGTLALLGMLLGKLIS